MSASTPRAFSAVIPVYNSAPTLELLCERVAAVLAAHCSEWEILLVDDGSADGSWPEIRRLAAAAPRVRGLRMSRNYGQHNAILCGIRDARYEHIVTLDDDLQNPPEQIPVLLAAFTQDVDCVYGYPRTERHGLLRDLASRTTKIVLARSMGSQVASRVSAFRVFRTVLRRSFERYDAPYVNIDVLLTWGSSRFAAVPVVHDSRAVGASNYTMGRLIAHALNMVTGFTVLPLQLASLLGLTFAAFGIVALIWVVGRYLIHGAVVPGFAFSASAIAIFSGVQLFALGVIGEYIARIHFRTMKRPAYTVRQDTRDATEDVGADSEPTDSVIA